MSKHHIQNLAEQISKSGHGSSPFHYKQTHDQINKPIESESSITKVVADSSAIQLLAYQIHQKKGGSDFDNWLEAEQTLMDNY